MANMQPEDANKAGARNKASTKQIEQLRKEMAKRPWMYDSKYAENEWLLLKETLDPLGKPKTIAQWKRSWHDQIKYVPQCTLKKSIADTPVTAQNEQTNHGTLVPTVKNPEAIEKNQVNIKKEPLMNVQIPYDALKPSIIKVEPPSMDIDDDIEEIECVGFSIKTNTQMKKEQEKRKHSESLNVDKSLKEKNETVQAHTTSDENEENHDPSSPAKKKSKLQKNAITGTTAQAALDAISVHNILINDLYTSVTELNKTLQDTKAQSEKFQEDVVSLLRDILGALQNLKKN